LKTQANEKLRKRLDIAAYIISVVVLLIIAFVRNIVDVGIDFSFLAPLHASFNVVVSVCLVFALVFIKQKNIEAHRKAIYGAMFFSALFLISYVIYHATTPETKYCYEGISRTIYFILLISHIVLAGISLPFILLTFNRGFTFSVVKHKKMAKWVFPVWLYVAITGPVVFLMLYPCYQ